MKLTLIAGGDCGRDDCEAISTTDRGTIAVQGLIIDKPTPDGEAVVEIQQATLLEAARALGH